MGKRLISLGLLLGLVMFLWGGCGNDDNAVVPVAPPLAWSLPAMFSGTWFATATPYSQLGGTIDGAVTSEGVYVPPTPEDPCAACDPCATMLEFCATFIDVCDPELQWKIDGTINKETGAMHGVSRCGTMTMDGVATLLEGGFTANGTWALSDVAGDSAGSWQVVGHF